MAGNKLYTVYSLRAEDSEEVRYIGITSQKLYVRLAQHICQNYKSKKTNWIKSLKNKNIRPILDIIHENIAREEANNLEIHYIKLFKSFGAGLLNMNDGGKLIHRDKLTEEHKSNISKAKKGKSFTPEHLKNLSISHKGKIPVNVFIGRFTDENKEQMKLLYLNGKKQIEIAKMFKCDPSVVSRIINNIKRNNSKY